jgi:hypothetical protein
MGQTSAAEVKQIEEISEGMSVLKTAGHSAADVL